MRSANPTKWRFVMVAFLAASCFEDPSPTVLEFSVVAAPTFVQLSWTLSKPSALTRIHRLDGVYQFVNFSGSPEVGSTTELEFTDNTVEVEKTYTYFVETSDSGHIKYGPLKVVTIPAEQPGVPSAPADLTVAFKPVRDILYGTYLGVEVSWPIVANAASYELLRSPTSGGPYTVVATELEAPIIDYKLEPGQRTYFYVARAIGLAGTSPNSAQLQVDLPEPPSSASGLVAASSGENSVRLTWTASPSNNVIGYRAAYSKTAGGPYEPWFTTTATSMNVPAAFGDTTYFIVQAFSELNGGSVLSNEVSFTAPAELAVPSGLASTFLIGKVRLTWIAVAGATSYDLYRQAAGAPVFSLLSSPTVAIFDDSGVSAGGVYQYYVRARNSYGESLSSTTLIVNVPNLPSAPSDLTISGSEGEVTLSWTAVAGANSYEVLRRASPSDPWVVVAEPTDATYSETAPSTALTTFYAVRAKHFSVGPESETHAPAPPTGVIAADGSAIELQWNEVLHLSTFEFDVYRGTSSGGPYAKIGSSVIPYFTDDNVLSGTTYFYVVKSTHGNYSSASSLEATATVPN